MVATMLGGNTMKMAHVSNFWVVIWIRTAHYMFTMLGISC